MELNVQIPAIISAVVFLAGAVFQLLLAIGLPLGAYSWGGNHQGVLPTRLRIGSLLSAGLLVLLALVMLTHTEVLSMNLSFIPTHIAVWVITLFMAINTLGNLASKSKKEKLVMTPQTLIAFIACLLVSLYSE